MTEQTEWDVAATKVQAVLDALDSVPASVRHKYTAVEVTCGACHDWLARLLDVPGVPAGARVLWWRETGPTRFAPGHEAELRRIEGEALTPYERGRERGRLHAQGQRSVRTGAPVWGWFPWPLPGEHRDVAIPAVCRCQQVDVEQGDIADATHRGRLVIPGDE